MFFPKYLKGFFGVVEGSLLMFLVVDRSADLSGDPIQVVGGMVGSLETSLSIIAQL